MPTELDKSVTGNDPLVFPDDATGRQYRLSELAVYDAEEVRNEIGSEDVPRFGSWLPVEIEDQDRDGWLNAPSELRRVLVEAEVEAGQLFEVNVLTQDGPRQSDPYRAEITVQDPDQDRL